MQSLPRLTTDSSPWPLPLDDATALRFAAALLADDANRPALLAGVLAESPPLVLWCVCRSLHWREELPADVAEIAAWLAEGEPLSLARRASEASLPPTHRRVDNLLTAALGCLTSNDLRAVQNSLPPSVARLLRDLPPPRDSGEKLEPEANGPQVLPLLLQKLARLRRLETSFATELEREKLAALKEFAYGASHEINNPLANISTRAQTLLREETDPERRRKLATINSQAFRAHEMIADMMLFAKPPPMRPSEVDLVAIVDGVLAELVPQAEEQGTVLLRSAVAQPIVLQADGNHLAVALRAMCLNSLEAMGVGGRIEISLRMIGAAPGNDWAEIVVSDTGPGIPPDVRAHLFDPYFSGREAGRGLGLGLSKCWRIVQLHGGSIRVENAEPQGACFAIRLPVPGRSQ